ncbi:MAG: selenide, water dikinase SelD [Oscillospiraceae bacterium]
MLSFLSSCTSGGCGAKIAPGDLSAILKKLPAFPSGNLLVGYDTSDDAAVYQMSAEQAIISTVDFFSPMVEDPRTFGRIAAANALSDVYAMGGQVLFALNLVCFPQSMDKKLLEEMLQGGAEKVLEAGAIICGGHSIYDHEPKYGLAVTGSVHPQRVLRNTASRAGECLILTKPLGVGLVMSALRGGLATPDAVNAATSSMERLNKYAAEKMEKYDVSACTDVTGFGLLAHACEMSAEKFTLVIDSAQLPLLPHAYDYAENYLATAAGQRNRNFLNGRVDVSNVPAAMQEIVFDPQTSGGLLFCVAEKDAAALLTDIQKDDPSAAIIGQVTPYDDTPVLLL